MAEDRLEPIEITFQEVETVLGITATLAHGITPSVIRMDIPASEGPISGTGDLTLKLLNDTVTFKDCLVDQSTAADSQSGRTWSVMLLDRRWKWQYQENSFHFNIRNGLDQIRVPPTAVDLIVTEGRTETESEIIRQFYDTKRSARAIADYVFLVMREFDIAANELPDDVFPEISREAVRPSEILAYLCDLFQCGVVLRTDNRVGIYKLGEGDELPDDLPIERESEAASTSVRPEKVRIITKPILYQWDFRLEPVSEEPDGNFVPVDLSSYKPDGGWSDWASLLLGFAGLGEGLDETKAEKIQRLAESSVYRAFRPIWRGGSTKEKNAPLVVADQTIVMYDQIAPFFPWLTTEAVKQGALRPQPAIVYGQFFDFRTWDENVTDAEFSVPLGTGDQDNKSIVDVGWNLDPRTGIVYFSQPMVKEDASNNAMAPDLFLRCSFHIRNEVNRERDRFIIDADVDPPVSAGLVASQVIETFEPTWRYDFQKVDAAAGADGAIIQKPKPVNNFDQLRNDAKPYLDAMKRRIEKVQDPRSVVYLGLHGGDKIELDGAIRTITYTANASGIRTFAQRNQDLGTLTTLPASQVRRLEIQGQLARDNARTPTNRLKVDENERAVQQQ